MSQIQVCAITGGASGIGYQIATDFLAASQMNVVTIIDLRFKDGIQQQLINQYGQDRVQFINCDVTKPEKFTDIFTQIFGKYKRLDIFINNAGVGIYENTILNNDKEDWEKYGNVTDTIVGINLTAVIKLSVLALYYMRINNIKGHIINVSSMGSVNPQGVCPIYSATKHAVNGFTRSLYYVKEKYGIRVNTLCPSFIETPLVTEGISRIQGVEVKPGTLIDLGIALKPSCMSDAFFKIHNDQNAHGELVFITLNIMGDGKPKISRKKYRDFPRLPGEHEIGGGLTRIPTKEEIQDYKNMMSQMMQKRQQKKAKL